MLCTHCRNVVSSDELFCSKCGKALHENDNEIINQTLYKISKNSQRAYSISVNKDNVLFEGDYWYLRDKEFIKCRNKKDIEPLQKFLGVGYLSKRSPKKCIMFVFIGAVLEVTKLIIDRITEWIDKINEYLQWFEQSISLPVWINYTMNIIAFVCILSGVALFFSKKKVIEISFVDKRICVPQNSMSINEYNMLYQSIQHAKDSIYEKE